MINLMYLVFIAMLALNMSKEVLTAFGLMNEKLVEANADTTQRNQLAMAGLAEKASEQPAKYAPLKEQADQINALTEELVGYIDGVKNKLTAEMDDPTDYETMDKSNDLDELWYKGGKVTPEGQEFIDKMDTYRNGVVSVIGADLPKVRAEVEKDFSTAPEKDRDGVEKDWLSYNYVGFPLVASITKLTQIQADAKTVESEILSDLLAGQLKSDVSMTNYQAIVVPEKTAFFNGENFKGKVVLGRFDNSLNFDKVTVNGKDLEKTVGGQVVLDFPAGNVGEQEIKGELQFKEGDSLVSIPITSSYAVIPKPNAAVISADKMNVVYRGVQNPMTISIPGVGSVSANAPGLSPAGGAGKYNIIRIYRIV
jgi:gliding motility-associated protein GldM